MNRLILNVTFAASLITGSLLAEHYEIYRYSFHEETSDGVGLNNLGDVVFDNGNELYRFYRGEIETISGLSSLEGNHEIKQFTDSGIVLFYNEGAYYPGAGFIDFEKVLGEEMQKIGIKSFDLEVYTINESGFAAVKIETRDVNYFGLYNPQTGLKILFEDRDFTYKFAALNNKSELLLITPDDEDEVSNFLLINSDGSTKNLGDLGLRSFVEGIAPFDFVINRPGFEFCQMNDDGVIACNTYSDAYKTSSELPHSFIPESEYNSFVLIYRPNVELYISGLSEYKQLGSIPIDGLLNEPKILYSSHPMLDNQNNGMFITDASVWPISVWHENDPIKVVPNPAFPMKKDGEEVQDYKVFSVNLNPEGAVQAIGVLYDEEEEDSPHFEKKIFLWDENHGLRYLENVISPEQWNLVVDYFKTTDRSINMRMNNKGDILIAQEFDEYFINDFIVLYKQ